MTPASGQRLTAKERVLAVWPLAETACDGLSNDGKFFESAVFASPSINARLLGSGNSYRQAWADAASRLAAAERHD